MLRRSLVGQWLWAYFNGPGPQFAPAVAFTAFVAIFPMVVGLVSLLLVFSPGQGLPHAVDRVLLQAFPGGTRRELAQLLRLVPRHLKTFGVISVLGTLWSGSSLFSCLGGALNAIHGRPGRNVLRQRLMGIRLVGVMVVAVCAMVLLESVGDRLPRSPVAGALLAALPLLLLVGFIYRVAPSHRPSIRHVLPGAVLATAAVEVVTMAFPLFANAANSVNAYGQALGVTLVILLWLYLVSHAVLLGASFNEARLRRGYQP